MPGEFFRRSHLWPQALPQRLAFNSGPVPPANRHRDLLRGGRLALGDMAGFVERRLSNG